jgi:hypothetical protein
LVLHALRLKGFADTPAVAAVAGLDEGDAAKHLEKAAAAGSATRRDGRIAGWALTAEGRAVHADLIAAELAEVGAHASVDASYRQFLSVNNELLTVCTDWQLTDGALNDHNDRSYDEAVIARLGAVDAAVQPVCRDLSAVLTRFSGYGPRLATALQRVQQGERDWFAKPMIDSYHTVWFELHEDLLATLHIERSREGSGS